MNFSFEVLGDLPTTFVLYVDEMPSGTNKLKVGNLQIEVEGAHSGLKWDSKTGLVTAYDKVTLFDKAIPYKGTGYGTIDVGTVQGFVKSVQDTHNYKITWKNLYL